MKICGLAALFVKAYWYIEIHLTLAYFFVFRWDRLGDIVVLPVSSFKDPVWDSFGDELWPIVAKLLGAQRLARQVWFVIKTSSKLPWCLLHSFFYIGFKPFFHADLVWLSSIVLLNC